jgi:beta-lactamase class A
MGLAAIHIETDRCITLKGSERFPMASTYKLPIAIQLLMLVDDGKDRGRRRHATARYRPATG